jgi:ribosomal-protein-alanine N-acetyltransferase
MEKFANMEKEKKINIKEADSDNEIKRIWEIRNHPELRKVSINQKEINLIDHIKWFEEKYLKNKKNKCFVLNADNQTMGYCRLDLNDNNEYMVSIALDPTLQGRGLGTKLLQEAIKLLNTDKTILAEVKTGNKPSLKLFQKNNFEIYDKNKDYIHFRYTTKK